MARRFLALLLPAGLVVTSRAGEGRRWWTFEGKASVEALLVSGQAGFSPAEIAEMLAFFGPKAEPGEGGGWRWLPFVNTYRTLCLAPTTEIERLFRDLGALATTA